MKKTAIQLRELPAELHLSIFAKLSPRTLGSCAAVCRQWNELSQDDDLWRPIYERDVAAPAPERDVKLGYSAAGPFAESFRHSSCDVRTITRQEAVRCAVFVEPQVVACGGDDRRVTLYDLRTNKELYVSPRHGGDVYALRYVPATRLLFVGCDQGWLYAYHVAPDCTGLELVREFTGHTSSVWKTAAVDEQRFVSASYDHTVRVWGVDQDEALGQFSTTANSAFLDVAVGNQRAYGAHGGGVTVIDIEGGMKQLHVLSDGTEAGATAVAVHQQRACVGTECGGLTLHDLRTPHDRGNKLQTSQGDWIYWMAMKEHLVVSSDDEGRMFAHDVRTGGQLWTEVRHSTGSLSFDIDWRHLCMVTASNDATVKIWQFTP